MGAHRDAETPELRLADLLNRAPPQKPLFILEDREISYGEMEKRSAALAGGLQAAGLQRGETIALFLNNVPDWIAIAFAAWRLGIGVMALNPRLGAKEIGDLVARSRSRALFFAPAYRDGACAEAVSRVEPAALASLQLVVSCDDSAVADIVPGARHVAIDDLCSSKPAAVIAAGTDACLYLATSGTTSLPKIVVHQQARVLRHVHDAADAVGFSADSRVLLAIPFCGGYGFTVAMTCIAAQVPIVLMDAFEPGEAGRLLNLHGVSHAMGTNDMLDKMLAVVSGERPFPHLRMFGHANFTPGLTELPAEADRRGVRMRGFFGLSETLAFVAARPTDAPLVERAEGGGRLVCADATYRIADPDTGEALPVGAVGEIQIKSPNIMTEYLSDPVRTAAAFTADGFFRTGDFGSRQADGCFTFITRMNDVLRVGGYLVAPEEIEDVVKKEAGIAACQVVAVATKQGPRPVAFVVMAAGHAIDTQAILDRCRRDLAVYKVPTRIFEIDAIPVTDGPNGAKVKRNVLRHMATERLAKDEAAA